MSDSAPGTGHRVEFRAITQVGENLNMGETGDSGKVCSGDFTDAKLVCTSVVLSGFGPGLISQFCCLAP